MDHVESIFSMTWCNWKDKSNTIEQIGNRISFAERMAKNWVTIHVAALNESGKILSDLYLDCSQFQIPK